MAGFDRVDRQSEELKHALDKVLRSDVKDPRMPEIFSITKVDLARDLGHCKVYVSAMTKDEN